MQVNLTQFMMYLKKLDWKTQDGCSKCRPAVNYYLLVKYNDDKYQNDKEVL